MNINHTKPILVTGANGFVASWIVKRLLDEGYTVHCAVRDPENDLKVGHLKELEQNAKGSIKFFKADLLTPNAYKEAMQGCELVYHTASPFTFSFKDPQKDLIDPAVNGTTNVLQSANETPTVKRVVVTSSCAAIYTDAIDSANAPNGILTEDVWNTTASLSYHPYSLSKTLAEQKAWNIANKQNRWDLVTINPPLVLGPSLNAKQNTSEAYVILKMFGDGQMRFGVPNTGIGIVDVRDVAEAHFKAGFTPTAKGRYIASAHNTSFLEMANELQPKYKGKLPLAVKALPKWLLFLIGPLANKQFTKRFVKNNINIPWNADSSKIKRELNMEFLPLRKTMEDSIETLIQTGII